MNINCQPISIVLPVLGKHEYTETFFKSLFETHSCFIKEIPDFEIIIINNGKDVETKDILNRYKNQYKDKIVILNQENNIGVAKSWNLGIEISKYDYIAFCNNDIEFMNDNCLKRLQQSIIKGKRVYWTSPSTCYNRDPKKRVFRLHHYEQLKYGHSIDSYVVGCCFMIPREAFEKIGIFDELFDIKYYEDLDFINRILQSKNKLKMTNDAIVYHAVGATSRITKGGEDNDKKYKKKWENTGFDILEMQKPKISRSRRRN